MRCSANSRHGYEISVWRKDIRQDSWFPRVACEPSAVATASRFVTPARRQLHSHAKRGNEDHINR